MDESRGYELGGIGYITKPFDPNEMTERVRSIIDRVRRGEREELRRAWGKRLHRD
jgi:DNA-binding response OmpR family regulator